MSRFNFHLNYRLIGYLVRRLYNYIITLLDNRYRNKLCWSSRSVLPYQTRISRSKFSLLEKIEKMKLEEYTVSQLEAIIRREMAGIGRFSQPSQYKSEKRGEVKADGWRELTVIRQRLTLFKGASTTPMTTCDDSVSDESNIKGEQKARVTWTKLEDGRRRMRPREESSKEEPVPRGALARFHAQGSCPYDNAR